MLVLIPLVLGVLAGVVSGGRIERWAEVRLRWSWLVVAALFVREAVALTPLSSVAELRYVYVLFLAVLVGWTAWHIRLVPWVWIIGIGALMNLAVIAANDFRMPVAAANAGRLVQAGHVGQYVVMGPDTRLSWLGDWLTVAGGFGGVYSPGDVVIGVGVAAVAFVITRGGAPTTKLDEISPELKGRE